MLETKKPEGLYLSAFRNAKDVKSKSKPKPKPSKGPKSGFEFDATVSTTSNGGPGIHVDKHSTSSPPWTIPK